jgi:hypothetical protein
MSDELDARLLRSFAAGEQPLADAQFVARVMAQLAAGGWRGWREAARGAARAFGAGLAAGVAAPLRLRYAGLVAGAVVAVSVLSVL